MSISMGTKIKSLRVMRGMFQEALSKQVGISRHTLISIERDEVTPSPETLKKIELAFGIDLASSKTDTAFETLAGA